MTAIIGRTREVGIGIETTYGTQASSVLWIPYESFESGSSIEDVFDESANGRLEKNSDSIITRKSSAPSMTLKAKAGSLGLLLKGILRSATVSADSPESGVNTHTFAVPTTSTAVSYTIYYKDDNTEKAITGVVIDSASLQFVQNDYVKVEISGMGKFPTDTTKTPVYVADTEFTGAMSTVKIANDISSLAGASAICMQEATLEFTNNVKQEDFYCLGNTEPSNAIYGAFESSISFTRNKGDDSIYDLWEAGTNQAIEVAIVDTGTTIGTSSNPSCTFQYAPARLVDYSEGTGLDDVVTESFSATGLYNATDGKLVTAQLINTTTSY